MRSDFRQPQLLLLPLIRLVLNTRTSFPQSHRQTHMDCQLLLQPSRYNAVRRPKRLPVMSISLILFPHQGLTMTGVCP